MSWDHWDHGIGVDRKYHFNTTSALTGFIHEWTDVSKPIHPLKLWKELSDILPKYRGKQEATTNYWTTGKTKRERLAEQMVVQKRQTQAQTELHDIYTNWWY